MLCLEFSDVVLYTKKTLRKTALCSCKKLGQPSRPGIESCCTDVQQDKPLLYDPSGGFLTVNIRGFSRISNLKFGFTF